MTKLAEILSGSAYFQWPSKNITNLTRLIKSPATRNVNYAEIRGLLDNSQDYLFAAFNSGYFSFPKKIRSLKRLLEHTGLQPILNMLFLRWINEFTPAGRHDSFDYKSAKSGWLLQGLLAQNLADFLKLGNPEKLFLQAYVQDIALLFLARCHPRLYHRFTQLSGDIFHSESEEMVTLGFCHSELSGKILGKIGFSPKFTRPVRHHHRVWLPETKIAGEDKPALVVGAAGLLTQSLLQPRKKIPLQTITQKLQQVFKAGRIPLIRILQKSITEARNLAKTVHPGISCDFSLTQFLLHGQTGPSQNLISYADLVQEVSLSFEKIRELERENAILKEGLEKNRLGDALTGLLTHSQFQARLEEEIARSSRHEYPVSLLIFDIRNFFLFNQTYGFTAGDDILRQLGTVFKNQLRETDIIGRVGGDEFAVLLPYSGRFQGRLVAEKLKRAINRLHFGDPERARSHQIHLDYGMQTLLPGSSRTQRMNLFQTALDELNKNRYAERELLSAD